MSSLADSVRLSLTPKVKTMDESRHVQERRDEANSPMARSGEEEEEEEQVEQQLHVEDNAGEEASTRRPEAGIRLARCPRNSYEEEEGRRSRGQEERRGTTQPEGAK